MVPARSALASSPSQVLSQAPSPAQDTQPLEPILIPKLRIQFADFPYLHYSID
ncbi:alpha-l1 nicotinic acetyl choline receptor [Frankliniella occidentalis]|nr:alpha-l1 nicotinic acetyl choline receptor [Frankliniella occidentalis]